MATGTITSLGLGSDLDLQSLLDTQQDADEAINDLKLDEIEELQAQEESLSSVQSKLLSMKSSALNLSLASTYLYRDVSSSDSDVVSATVLDGTDTGTHTIETSRLASNSSYMSDGFESESSTVYVPTIQQSTDGYESVNDTALEQGDTLTISYGNEDDPTSFTITAAADMTVQDLVDAINNDAANQDSNGDALVTASTYVDEDGAFHIQIESASDGTGEDNRVEVAGSNGVSSFTAPTQKLSFTVGDSEVFTISIPAETTLEDLAERINDADDNPGVTATVIYTGTGENPYQLVIEADDSGEDNRISIINNVDALGLTESNGDGYTMTGDEAISFDTAVTIDNTNNTIVFEEVDEDGNSVSLTAQIDEGTYETAEELAEAVELALENISKEDGNNTDYSVEIDFETGLMTISEAGTLESVTINWEDAACTAADTLGFSETKTITPMDSSLNAMVTVDGITYQRQENTGIDNIVDGLTLKLYSTGNSTITIESDTEDIITELTNLVDTYNELLTEIDENDDYDEDEEAYGSLAQSSTIRTLKTSLQDLITTTVDTGGDITSLLDIGIEIDEDDGSLTLDEEVLEEALENSYDEIISLLKGTDTEEGLGDVLNDAFSAYAISDGYLQDEIDSIEEEMDRLEDDYEDEVDRIEKKYEIMASEYSELDAYLSELANIETYIDTMMSTDDD